MLFQKKMRLAILLLLVSDVTSFAQENCSLTLTGNVSTTTGEVLPGAYVSFVNDSLTVSADASGNFVFDHRCAGAGEVAVRFVGYKSQKIAVWLMRDTVLNFRLEPEATQLQEVIIADKAQHTEHAQNFTVLGEKQLASTAGKSLGESLREVAGVNTIQAGPGIFKPVIHGVHSQRILILNYGIRQEGQQWGAEHAPEIDPFIASNIVVIKDASSIKYGTDALGGVIVVNPAPLPEKNEFGGSVNTVLQSNGRSGAVSGMLEGGIKNHDGWGWRVQGTAKRSGDFFTPDYMLTNTGLKELNFSVATGYHKEKFGAEVFFSHFQTELGILKGTSINSKEDLQNAMNQEPPYYTAPFSYDIADPHQEVSHNLLKLNGHIKTERGDFRLQYGYQHNLRKEFNIRRRDVAGIPTIDLQLNTHSVEAEYELNASAVHTICIGITGMLQDNVNIAGTQSIPFVPNFTSQSAGAFLINKWSLTRWTIDLGARYDYRDYTVAGRDVINSLFRSSYSFQNPSATAGASVQLKKNQSLSFNLSSAWRPPHVAELYSAGIHQSAASIEYGLLLDEAGGVRDIGDVSFKTENALKFVTTYGKRWEGFQVEIGGFANYVFNYIYLKPQGVLTSLVRPLPYLKYAQTDVFFTGLDVSGAWKINTSLSVLPKASLLRVSDVKNNDYLLYIPSNRYEIALRYEGPKKFLLKDFFVQVRLKYVAKQNRAPRVVQISEIDDSNTISRDAANFDFMAAPDAYFLPDAAVGFSSFLKQGRFDFRLSVENMLNAAYREYTNRLRYYADEPGRNFSFSVKYVF